jgi:hypothetical protein
MGSGATKAKPKEEAPIHENTKDALTCVEADTLIVNTLNYSDVENFLERQVLSTGDQGRNEFPERKFV